MYRYCLGSNEITAERTNGGETSRSMKIMNEKEGRMGQADSLSLRDCNMEYRVRFTSNVQRFSPSVLASAGFQLPEDSK